MKAAFLTGSTQPWYFALGNASVRRRLGSRISHVELVFEPGDGVDHLMPDGTTEPDASGAYWTGSSVAGQRLPEWSPRRPGRRGGVRFKRTVLSPSEWILVDLPGANPLHAAMDLHAKQGALYDWQLILGFLAWPIRQKEHRWACHEIVGYALGLPEPDRFDPASLYAAIRWKYQEKQ